MVAVYPVAGGRNSTFYQILPAAGVQAAVRLQMFKPLTVNPVSCTAGVQAILLTAGVQDAGCVFGLIVSRLTDSRCPAHEAYIQSYLM